jgi:hypothetical protein
MRSSRPSRGPNRPPQRSHIPAIRLALLATVVVCGTMATSAYFAFRDDVLAKAYLELMQFIGRFRFYSPFNAMLIRT